MIVHGFGMLFILMFVGVASALAHRRRSEPAFLAMLVLFALGLVYAKLADAQANLDAIADQLNVTLQEDR